MLVWTSTYARYVDMFMTLSLVVKKWTFPQVQSGKMYPMTSDALFAELIKMHLKRSSENLITFLLTDKLAEEGICPPLLAQKHIKNTYTYR